MKFEEQFPSLKGRVVCKIRDLEDEEVYYDCYTTGIIEHNCFDKQKVRDAIDKFMLPEHPYSTQIAAMCALKDVKKELGL